ncbi:MAG: hypothetical protein WCD79_18870 [Chthoniobacteraceae bacterium]
MNRIAKLNQTLGSSWMSNFKKTPFLPNKANFYSVEPHKTNPIQSQANPFLSHFKANLIPNL